MNSNTIAVQGVRLSWQFLYIEARFGVDLLLLVSNPVDIPDV